MMQEQESHLRISGDRAGDRTGSDMEGQVNLGKRKGERDEDREELAKKSRLDEEELEVDVEYLTGDDRGIAVISLNRPGARNALSRHLVRLLKQALEDVAQERAVRAVILRSRVRGVFCAGADLKERSDMGEDEVMGFLRDLRGLVQQLEDLPMAVIAALDGAALGGGLELALGCDIRVAGGEVRLGLPEVRLGVIPGAGGTQRLARLVSISIFLYSNLLLR